MKLLNSRGRAGRAASSRHVERLENRCLLSATLVSAIPAQNLVTSTGGTAQINLATSLNDPSLTGGTIVVMQTPLGNIPLQLFDSQTPNSVANFVTYINNGQYTPTIIQRSAPGFVLQGGGTKPDGSENIPVASLNSEAGISNTAGTIAMALSNGPNSGTNQWFINLQNNPILDGTLDGGPFTTFGRVIDDGMDVVGAISQLPIINGSAENPNWFIAPGDGLPVINYSGSSTPTTVPPANLVTDNIVVIPAGQQLTYSVVSANPSLVTASVNGGVLTLAAATGVTTGSTTVTATVTDLSGTTASSTFAVTIHQAQPTIADTLAGPSSTAYVASTPLKLKEKLTITAASAAASGTQSARILLSPDQSAADSVLTLASESGKVKLKSGKTQSVNVKFPKTIPTSVPAGLYHVLISSTDTAGNQVATDSGQTITIVAPVIDLNGALVGPTSAKVGKKTTFNFTVTNSSSANIAAVGSLPFAVETSPDGLLSDATALTSSKKSINLKPGKSTKVTFAATLSTTTFLEVNLDPGNVVFPDDLNPANNTFSSLITVA